jgi:TRAP-type C4-dicarboxylate transport system permease small subunit
LTNAGGAIARGLGWVAGAALFAMMILTFADVTGRKFLSAIPGAFELSEMLMVVLLFSSLPLVAWHAEHVCFELVDTMYKGRWNAWSRRFMDACCAIAFGSLAFATWGLAQRTIAEHEVSIRLQISIGIFVYLMAVLLASAALMHLLRTFGAEPPKSHNLQEFE